MKCKIVFAILLIVLCGHESNAQQEATGVFWTSFRGIHYANFADTIVHDIVRVSLHKPRAIFLDKSKQQVYWTDAWLNKIQRINYDGFENTDILSVDLARTGGTRHAGRLAIDQTSDKIYWVENVSGQLKRSDLVGSNPESFPVSSTELAASIAIDTLGGKVYWGSFSIKRANLDGTAVEELIPSGEHSITGMVIDSSQEKIYWISSDCFDCGVKRANLDGTEIEMLPLKGRQIQGLDIDMDNKKLYMTDWYPGKIIRADLDGSAVEEVVSASLNSPKLYWGIRVDSENDRIFWIETTDTGFASEFPLAKEMAPKIKTANLNGLEIKDLVVNEDTFWPQSISLDENGQHFYWNTLNPYRIQRAAMDGSQIEDIFTTNDNLTGVKFHANQLYWINSSTFALQRASIDGNVVENLTDPGLYSISDFAIDKRASKLYISDANTYTILQGNLDGSQLEVVTATEFRGHLPLTIDPENERIYWYDSELKSVSYQGEDAIVFATPMSQNYDMEFDPVSKNLYWANWINGTIQIIKVADNEQGAEQVINNTLVGFGIALHFREPLDVGNESMSLGSSKINTVYNYPNPFNDKTTISYSISQSTSLEISLYDSMGRFIDVLFSGRQVAGEHKIALDRGELSSGVYFYRIVAENSLVVKNMLLIK